MKRQLKKGLSNGLDRNIACVDLFCGAGGLTHGLISAGVSVVAGVDVDQACRYPYDANNPGAQFHLRDVSELKGTEVNTWYGDADVRVLAGCAPCQPFSSYTQRYDTRGTDRWWLLKHFGRLVEEIHPDVVTMENVPAVIHHEVFESFVLTLERQGYGVWYGVVDSSEYGLPQRRRRTVLLASLNGEIRMREPNGTENRTVHDVLSGLPSIEQGASHPDDLLHVSSRLSPLEFGAYSCLKTGRFMAGLAEGPGGGLPSSQDRAILSRCLWSNGLGRTRPDADNAVLRVR